MIAEELREVPTVGSSTSASPSDLDTHISSTLSKLDTLQSRGNVLASTQSRSRRDKSAAHAKYLEDGLLGLQNELSESLNSIKRSLLHM
ncbi:hypothetical protein K466DRAFT_590059, partial [Polyporus arcularius HHB13444]